MFGALANGTADDTTAIQTAINFAALLGKGVIIESTFKITKVRIKNGLAYLSGGGELRASARTGEGMIELDGPFFGGMAVNRCTISGLKLNANQQASCGIFGSAAKQCVITGNHIYNLYGNSAIAPFGIRMHHDCTFNKIIANDVRLPADQPYGTFNSAVGIMLGGGDVNGYGGFDYARRNSNPDLFPQYDCLQQCGAWYTRDIAYCSRIQYHFGQYLQRTNASQHHSKPAGKQ